MPDSPAFKTLVELSAAIAAGRVSPVDVMDDCLARIDRLDPKLQAFISIDRAAARLAAEGADRTIRSGHQIGPLHGIPIAVKDLVEIEGRVTTGGTAAWRSRVSRVTATVQRRLNAAGMITLGKTHTVEFAYGGWGTNQHLGTPWNPWDRTTHRTPGGSSSGSGVAVGARLAPVALGTDTGGSVRVPAAWNGVTGLKTTIGRISTHGILPLSQTLDTPGPITRSVEDAAIMLELLQGYDPLDPMTHRIEPARAIPTLRRGVKNLRLARMPAIERDGVHASILAAYDASLERLASLGAEIVDLNLPVNFVELGQINGRIMSAEAYAMLAHLADDPSQPLDEAVRPRIRAGASISSRDYLTALRERERLKAAYAAATETVDAVLTPTTMTPPIPVSNVDQATTPALFTRWVNFLDLCALAVPNGATADGLPISLQIVCRGYEEAMALRIGWAYQNTTDWHTRVPSLAQ